MEEASDEEGDQFSTIKRSPRDIEKKTVTSPNSTTTTPQELINNEINNKEIIHQEPIQQITDQQFVDEYLYGFTTPGLQARALYDYQAGKSLANVFLG